MTCTLCDLHKTCKTVKMERDGSGSIVFLGEAPGAEEDNTGRPFVGASGAFLRNAIKETGLSLESVRFTNAVRCRPPGNATPSAKQLKTCNVHLREEFAQHPPTIVVPLGNIALKALREAGLLSVGGTITALQGNPIAEEGKPIIFPMLHPAYILRNPNAIDMYVGGFNKLEDIIKNGPPEKSKVDYDYSDEVKDLKAYVPKIVGKGLVAYDIETSTLHPADGGEIVSFAFSWEKNTGFGFYLTPENRAEALEILHTEILENVRVRKIIQHAKFELMWSMSLGRTIKNIADTMLMHWHVNETKGTHGLKTLALNYTDLGFYDQPLEEYKKQHKECDPEKGGSYKNFPVEILLPYNCMDADATYRVYHALQPLLSEDQKWLLEQVQIPSAYSLAKMELVGAPADWEYIAELKETLEAGILEIQDEMRKMPGVAEYNAELLAERGTPISFSSTKDLRVLLFEKLGLEVLYESEKTGDPSTDKHVLGYHAKKSPVAAALMELRQLQTGLSTFVNGAIERKKPDGRIHTSYGMAHTVTGRYTSTNPNLQNIPRDALYRNMWVPFKGHWMLQADYSQIEVRIMAMFSKDPNLIQYFKDDVDVHRYIASKVFRKPPEEITKEERTQTKRTVFGLNYGQGAEGLAEELGITKAEAERFLAAFFGEFQAVNKWMVKTKRKAQTEGFVETIFGRIRRLPDAGNPRGKGFNEALRQAINAPIQGTAADILAYAQGRIEQFLTDERCETKILLTVHDSLVFSVPPEEAQLVIPAVKLIMEDVEFEWCTIPIKADFEIGKRWGDLAKLEGEDVQLIGQGANLGEIYEKRRGK